MGVHILLTQSNDTTVRAPVAGEVLVANDAGAWMPMRLDDSLAAATLRELRLSYETLEVYVSGLEARLETVEKFLADLQV